MVEINKGEFEQFAKEKFPNKVTRYRKNFIFIQAGNCLGDNLHYEYVDDKMQLHIEGDNWEGICKFLRNSDLRNTGKVDSSKWTNDDCAWTLLNTELSDWEKVKEAFITIDSIINPYIQEFEGHSVQAQFTTVRGCIEKKLSIPDYQRPYRWTEHNVEQLLEDISKCKNEGKLQYLIGSVILHKDKDTYNIVDGQQRITTLLLLIKALTQENAENKNEGYNNSNSTKSNAQELIGFVNCLEYNHCDSFYHIKENFHFIQRWLTENILDGECTSFLDFVLDKCQFVEITVTKLHEAFQMFESQNGRGKELEAYNLLKAYHIRAMNGATESDKIACDIRWESAAMYGNECVDLLRQLFNEQLYRSRLWARGENAYQFGKNHIDEFKGVTLSNGKRLDFAYQNAVVQQEIANSFMRSMNMNLFPIKSRFLYGDPDNMNPFVNINQLILNGKAFFDYVETYVEIYKRLFIQKESSQLKKFKDFFKCYCEEYEGSHRRGDGYVREVYKSAIMMIFDRFGEEGVNKFYKDLYICLYSNRLEKWSIQYRVMAKVENSSGVFKIIEHAKTMSDLYVIRKKAQEIKNRIQGKNDNDLFKIDNNKILEVFKESTKI